MANNPTPADTIEVQNFFQLLQNDLNQGLSLYWHCAEKILDRTGIRLNKPSQDYFALENNFFSALFLYSYYRAGLSPSKRILFAAANQCLRGMVTGCDNILDNEYKKTLDTDLPAAAEKFRSILDIMVSDRILVMLLHKGYADNEICFDQILQANTASLHALLKSGVQEASEEKGIDTILTPEEILTRIHPIKTGILFQAPWVLPELIEKKALNHLAEIKDGLFHIGLGCQILDDMVDLSMDTKMNRHNFVVSCIRHGKHPSEQDSLEQYTQTEDSTSFDPDFLFQFPHAGKTAAKKAVSLLKKGTGLLFDEQHEFMIPYSIDFFAKRIGAHRFLEIMKD